MFDKTDAAFGIGCFILLIFGVVGAFIFMEWYNVATWEAKVIGLLWLNIIITILK